jgi:hypothetical protein
MRLTGPRAGLNPVENGKISYLYRKTNPDPSAVRPVASTAIKVYVCCWIWL